MLTITKTRSQTNPPGFVLAPDQPSGRDEGLATLIQAALPKRPNGKSKRHSAEVPPHVEAAKLISYFNTQMADPKLPKLHSIMEMFPIGFGATYRIEDMASFSDVFSPSGGPSGWSYSAPATVGPTGREMRIVKMSINLSSNKKVRAMFNQFPELSIGFHTLCITIPSTLEQPLSSKKTGGGIDYKVEVMNYGIMSITLKPNSQISASLRGYSVERDYRPKSTVEVPALHTFDRFVEVHRSRHSFTIEQLARSQIARERQDFHAFQPPKKRPCIEVD